MQLSHPLARRADGTGDRLLMGPRGEHDHRGTDFSPMSEGDLETESMSMSRFSERPSVLDFVGRVDHACAVVVSQFQEQERQRTAESNFMVQKQAYENAQHVMDT